MKAVIKLSGKQFLVTEGDKIISNKVKADEKSLVKVDEVFLLIDGEKVKIGQPKVKGAVVELELLETKKGKKIKIIKFKAKKRYKRIKGHRQILSKLRVKKIGVK